jgi:hypothetical protein
MRKRTFAIFFMLVFTCAEALAASKYAIVKQKGFLDIENFAHWTTLDYRYAHIDSDSTDTTHRSAAGEIRDILDRRYPARIWPGLSTQPSGL